MDALYKPTVTSADLARLKEERDRADRLYNEALTSLDQSLLSPRTLPGAAAPLETAQLERLNRLWQVLPVDPVPFTGWRGRLGAFVWRMLGPVLQRQQEFNAALVDHANRSAAAAAESAAALSALAAAVSEELSALVRLQSRLIAYLQQVTLYIDTKDRFETGLLWHELRLRTDGLAAGLSAIGDEMLKSREHALAHEQRLEGRLAEGLARLAARAASGAATPQAETPTSGAAAQTQGTAIDGRGDQLATARDASTYAGFEDAYRGSVEEIQQRLAEYLPLFTGASDVVDLGCGRGEFLQALREQGIAARGVDLNPAMVERCRALGLDITQGDALEFLAGVPDASLGGVMATQVVEHLPPHRLLALLDVARAKMRPGARLVLETVNPACWAAFFSSYIRDLTHVQPVHPDTLRYLLIARGFRNVDIRFSSPYPPAAKLHPLPLTLGAHGPDLAAVVQAFNRNVEVLNGQLFTYLDYAAIAEA